MNWYKQVLNNYLNFSGRARRKEFWFFSFYNFIFLIIAFIIDDATRNFGLSFAPFATLYFLFSLMPGLSVLVRRLHDTNRSGWFFLAFFLPMIGHVILLKYLFEEGTKGDNFYGEDPKKRIKNAYNEELIDQF